MRQWQKRMVMKYFEHFPKIPPRTDRDATGSRTLTDADIRARISGMDDEKLAETARDLHDLAALAEYDVDAEVFRRRLYEVQTEQLRRSWFGRAL